LSGIHDSPSGVEDIAVVSASSSIAARTALAVSGRTGVSGKRTSALVPRQDAKRISPGWVALQFQRGDQRPQPMVYRPGVVVISGLAGIVHFYTQAWRYVGDHGNRASATHGVETEGCRIMARKLMKRSPSAAESVDGRSDRRSRP
jgi:hypothetical protein